MTQIVIRQIAQRQRRPPNNANSHWAWGGRGLIARGAIHTMLDTKNLHQLFDECAHTMEVLEAYDHNTLKPEVDTTAPSQKLDYQQAQLMITELKQYLIHKQQASPLFGKENRHGALEASLHSIDQSFDGRDVYPSREEKAAHLLYLIIKNHPFVDGNKRIGAFLFVFFLKQNNLCYPRQAVANNALIHLALSIAKSDPKEKSTLIKLIITSIQNYSS